MKTTELAWAAGFFDGEGTVVPTAAPRCTGSRGGRTVRVVLSIAQTDRAVLRRFRRAVEDGSITGPYKYTNNQRPYWKYTLHREVSVRKVARLLYPYLSPVKRRQFRDTLKKVG